MILVEFSFILPNEKVKQSDSHLCLNGFDAKDLGKKLIYALDLNQVEITWETSTTNEYFIINKPQQL